MESTFARCYPMPLAQLLHLATGLAGVGALTDGISGGLTAATGGGNASDIALGGAAGGGSATYSRLVYSVAP